MACEIAITLNRTPERAFYTWLILGIILITIGAMFSTHFIFINIEPWIGYVLITVGIIFLLGSLCILLKYKTPLPKKWRKQCPKKKI